jgi:hypothetical protein
VQTPADYAARYEKLAVPSLDGTADLATEIAVDKYLLGVRPGGFDERVRLEQKIQKDLAIRRKADKSAKISIRVSTADGIAERSFEGLNHKDSNDQLWKLISYPFVGKGSPEGLQALLQLAAVELPGSPALIKPANFQAYCTKWLGLDCNGLVGNFLRHIYAGIDWWDVTTTESGLDPNKDIKTIWDAFDGTERKTAAEIDFKELNLLVMVDDTTGKIVPGGPSGKSGHIMISQPHEIEYDTDLATLGVAKDKEVPGLIVLESTAAIDSADKKNGVAKSAYAYVNHVKLKDVIRVRRGLNNTKLSVRIKGAKWNG